MKTRRPKGASAPLPGQLDLFSMTMAPETSALSRPTSTAAATPQRARGGQLMPRDEFRAAHPVSQPPSMKASPTLSAPVVKAPTAITAEAPPTPAIQKPPRNRQERKAGALFDVVAAAEHCGLSVSTLNKLRCKGGGPKFVKITGAAVRYDPNDLDAWIASRRRGSTSEG